MLRYQAETTPILDFGVGWRIGRTWDQMLYKEGRYGYVNSALVILRSQEHEEMFGPSWIALGCHPLSKCWRMRCRWTAS